jgi:hypothetical protein
MTESTPNTAFSPHASLAALGNYLQQCQLLAPIQAQVQIAQKTIKYTPFDKLRQVFLLLLTGAHHMIQINTQVRADPALCQAFGKEGGAEQSVVQDTLDACTQDNVRQMQQAVQTILHTHSRAYRHDYQKQFQLLDVDLSGRVCGKEAQDATKGYFSDAKGATGRQEGRVYASWYEEIVSVRLFPGNTTTAAAVQPLLADVQETLQLTPWQRSRTIIRLDAGGGTTQEINACLEAGYQFHGKDISTPRAKNLAESVTTWYADPHRPGRQVGLVTQPSQEYVRPVVRIALRWWTKKGLVRVSVLISTLCAQEVFDCIGTPEADPGDPVTVLLAYAHFYDGRGGGIETSFKQDRQSFGRRNKKRFAAQAMLLWLEALAHNVLIWSRSWLSAEVPSLATYGLLRLVRDGLAIPGRVGLDATGHLATLLLHQAHPLAAKMQQALQSLLARQKIEVCLGEI